MTSAGAPRVPSTLLLETWLLISLSSLANNSRGSAFRLAPCPGLLCVHQHAQLFMWVLGIKHRTTCLQGKLVTKKAISPALLTSPFETAYVLRRLFYVLFLCKVVYVSVMEKWLSSFPPFGLLQDS